MAVRNELLLLEEETMRRDLNINVSYRLYLLQGQILETDCLLSLRAL